MKEEIEKLIKEFNPERKEVQDESFDSIEVKTTGSIDDILKSINSAKKKGATLVGDKSMFDCLFGGGKVAIKTRLETDKEYKSRCDRLLKAELEKITKYTAGGTVDGRVKYKDGGLCQPKYKLLSTPRGGSSSHWDNCTKIELDGASVEPMSFDLTIGGE